MSLSCTVDSDGSISVESGSAERWRARLAARKAAMERFSGIGDVSGASWRVSAGPVPSYHLRYWPFHGVT